MASRGKGVKRNRRHAVTIRVLGSYGAEAPDCRNASYLVEKTLAIDAGSLVSALPKDELLLVKDILLTHAHLDHTKDLTFLAEAAYGRVNDPIRVHGSGETIAAISNHLFNDLIWPDFSILPSKARPIIEFIPLKNDVSVQVSSLDVTPVSTNHFGGSMGYFVSDGKGTVLFTGDTGPTDRIWEEARVRQDLRVIIVDVSFPNRLQDLAEVSRHLTPALLEKEMEKLQRNDVTIFACHMKPLFIGEILHEISKIRFPVAPLVQGKEIVF